MDAVTAHDHLRHVPGCFRCDLSKEESAFFAGPNLPGDPTLVPVVTTTLVPVPNQPKTPLHSFRVDDALWEAAKRRAEERGEALSDALRKFLRRYTR